MPENLPQGMDPVDASIVRAFLRGDVTALTRVDGWINVVLARDFTALREDWGDLFQEVRIRLLRNLRRGDFNGHARLRTYVHRITKNVAIDLVRKAYRRREVSFSSSERLTPAVRMPSPGQATRARDLIQKLVLGLNREDQLLVRLIFQEHASYTEVATTLNMTVGAVKTRVHRCKARLLTRYRSLEAKTGENTFQRRGATNRSTPCWCGM